MSAVTFVASVTSSSDCSSSGGNDGLRGVGFDGYDRRDDGTGGGRDAAAPRDLRERRGLDGGADGDDLVRVHAIERRRAEELLDAAAHERDARRAAHEDDLVERR